MPTSWLSSGKATTLVLSGLLRGAVSAAAAGGIDHSAPFTKAGFVIEIRNLP